jgi:hypothetical protein
MPDTYTTISELPDYGSVQGTDRIAVDRLGAAVTAGAFIVGQAYQIVTVGSTSFTAIGATSNTVGAYFVATGVGSGSGTAAPINTGEAPASAIAALATKATVGLDNCDNTSDLAKPISTATQAALNLKATQSEAAAAAPVQSVSLSVPSGWSASTTNTGGSVTLTLGLPTGFSLPSNASQANWDTAYAERVRWDGGATGLVAATGRASLGLAAVAASGAYIDLSGRPTLGTAAATDASAYATAAQGGKADTAVQPAGLTSYVQTSDARLSDSREWSAATVAQATAEAGISTVRVAYNPLRVFQSIAAYIAANFSAVGQALATAANAAAAQTTLGLGTTDAPQFSRLGLGVAAVTDLELAVGGAVAQLRQTVTAASSVYTLDATAANEFLTAAAIAGAITVNLSNLASIPSGYVWRGVLRFAYTSGTITWFSGNTGYTVKWDGGSAITPTASDQEAVIIEVVGGSTIIEVAAMRGRA